MAEEHTLCCRSSDRVGRHTRGGLAWVRMGSLPTRAEEQSGLPGTLRVRGGEGTWGVQV